jgi:hypothetical protein
VSSNEPLSHYLRGFTWNDTGRAEAKIQEERRDYGESNPSSHDYRNHVFIRMISLMMLVLEDTIRGSEIHLVKCDQ